jgi:hypothetical protein
VITGTKALSLRNEIAAHFFPNVFFAGATNGDSQLRLLENRYVTGKNLIYICENKSCKLPVESVDAALKLLGTR